MKYLSAILCLSVIVVVAADYGYFVPKSFYKISENGERSPLHYINSPADLLSHRARRSAQVNPNGGFFFPNLFPNFPAPNFPVGGGSGSGSSTFTSSQVSSAGPSLNSRFGEDEPVVTGQTHTVTSHNGQFTATHHHVDKNGQVHTTVEKGKL